MALQVWLPLNGNLNNQGLNNTAFTGSTTFEAGKIGQAGVFGTAAKRAISSATVTLNSQVTIAFWIKIKTWVNWGRIFNLYNNDKTNTISCVSNTSTDKRIGTQVSKNGTNLTDSYNGSFDLNTWYHFTMVINGTTKQHYINGSLVGTATLSDSMVTTDYTVMCGGTADSGTPVDMDINDFRVYDNALSPKEIEILSRGLVCHYPLSDRYIENTTNLIDVSTVSAGTISGWGGHTGQSVIVDASDYPIPCNECNKFAITYSGSGGGGCGWRLKRVTSTPSATYTYSCYIKTPDTLSPLNTNILYIYEYKSDGTKIRELGFWSTANNQYIGDGWYRIWGTFTTDATSGYFDIYNFVYPTKTCDYYIGCWQLEIKDHMTPYVFGSRAETTIYDCSGHQNNATPWAYDNTGSIDISGDTARYSASTFVNSASPSSGQAAGTRYIYGNCELIKPEKLTVAFWCKPITGYGNTTVHGEFSLTNYDIGQYAAVDYQEAPLNHRDGGFDINGITGTTYTHKRLGVEFTANQWHHYVITYDGRYGKLYKDAVQVSSADMGATMPLGDMKGIVIGFSKAGGVWRHVQSYYSDVRLYVTALSATQIAELYNTAVSVANNGTLMGYELVEV